MTGRVFVNDAQHVESEHGLNLIKSWSKLDKMCLHLVSISSHSQSILIPIHILYMIMYLNVTIAIQLQCHNSVTSSHHLHTIINSSYILTHNSLTIVIQSFTWSSQYLHNIYTNSIQYLHNIFTCIIIISLYHHSIIIHH